MSLKDGFGGYDIYKTDLWLPCHGPGFKGVAQWGKFPIAPS